MFIDSITRRLWLALPLLGSFLFVLSAPAQSPPDAAAQRAGPPIVHSIEVQYSGPMTVSRERVLAQMRTKVGQPYSEIVAEQDIRSLYGTGAVQNVRIFGQLEGEGIKVIVAIQTRANLREIQIDGATRVSAKRLRKDIGVKLNAPLNEDDLEKGRQKIFDLYQARGFNDVKISFRVEPIDAAKGTARVIYTVDEGVRGQIVNILFEGNRHFKDGILRKQMKTKRKTIISFLDKSGRLNETQLENDLDSVREYYQNHGYVDVVVREVRRERRANGAMNIIVVVDEGPLYRVGKISLVGYKATTEQRLRLFMKVKEGAIYSPKAIKDDAKAIADGYGAGGYVDLSVRTESAPARGGVIDLTYHLEEGQRSFVQRITITGNTRTKDKVLRREILISPGDVYNTVRVESSKKRLENLGYFSKVDTFPVDTDVGGRKDLDVEVEEKRTGSLNFGAGFSTIDSLVAFVELTQGNFDLFNWPQFTGGGQKFRLRLQAGTQRRDFELALTEPWFLDKPISLGGSVFYHEANYFSSVYDQRNYGLSVEVRKGLMPFLYAIFSYRLEHISILNLSADATPELRAETGATTKSQDTLSFVYDRRDSSLLTRTGERISYTTYVAGGPLGGNERIYGFDLEASKYFHFKWDTILVINAEVAGVDTWGVGKEPVKIFDKLFLGGANNLRGFNFRDVGPKDAHGEPLGGQSLARATIEYTFPIIEKARGALFYDTGFVNSGAYQYGFNNIASDVGFGIRLDLPVGPLRIDYGFPLQRAGNKGGGQFNFNVGYQF